ncbi:glycyl-radical enzyme activating protein [Muricomes intestini]|uniref:glycyl-radical enzyme activating protein n=1 Tax=Muricomes intestini TaxID=1796634 RepID=UPI002FE1882A
MAELMVFDLQRFALHDGPGIRTTIFLKGCPLDCVWCHNPESKKTKAQLGFLEKNCVGCGKCQEVCKHDVHIITQKGCHEIDYSNCVQCGCCANTCPSGALKIYGKRMTSEEIIETVMKDWDFYQKSGGGLTVSGGEPMLQFECLLELLKKAKAKGLHVCLDTSGQAPEEKYLTIAEYVDLFLFDYKMTDEQQHRRYTGVDNQLILKNLDSLGRHKSHVYLRCPIIPGINDNEIHYRSIAQLSRKYDNIDQVNLMMYHDMAKGKAAQIGEEYSLPDLKSIEAKEKRRIYEKVESYGCLRLQES